MSLVLQFSVKPPDNRFRYPITDSCPRATTSGGGVRNEGQLLILKAEDLIENYSEDDSIENYSKDDDLIRYPCM